MINKKVLFRELNTRKKSEVAKRITRYRAKLLEQNALSRRMQKRFEDEVECRINSKLSNIAALSLPTSLNIIGDVMLVQLNPNKISREIASEVAAMLPDGLEEDIKGKKKSFLNNLWINPGEVCAFLKCTDAHIEDTESHYELVFDRLEQARKGDLGIFPSSQTELLNLINHYIELLDLTILASKEYMHTLILVDALGISMPSEFRKFETDGLVKRIHERRTGWDESIAKLKKKISENDLARLLIMTLHPTAVDRILAISTVNHVEETKIEPLDELVENVNNITSASRAEILFFKKLVGDDPEKIASVISLHKYGISSNLAVYAVEKGLGKKEAKLLSVAEPHLESIEMTLDDAYKVLCRLQEDLFKEAFEDGGLGINGWLSVMPPTEEMKWAFAALLSRVCEAPESREELAEKLDEYEDEIIEIILKNDKCLDEFDKTYKNLQKYAERFVKKESAEADSTEEEEDQRDFYPPEDDPDYISSKEAAQKLGINNMKGVKPSEVHRALKRNGFEVLPGKGGHYAIYYKDEAVKDSKGQPVRVIKSSAGTEIPYGSMKNIVKSCVLFKETKDSEDD